MQKTLLSCVLCATMAFGAADVLPVEKRTFEQSKFVPDISLIVDASLVKRSVSDDEVSHLEIPGVVHGLLGSHSHGEHAHSTYNAENGFNINYAELILSSSVDPMFTLDGVFHFSETGVAIEEAYFTSTSLGHGLRLKGGKFQSNFGYINETHHHAWDFGDMPLVYEAFLGMHGINEKGLQLQWTAPTSTYLMLGAEVLQGTNEYMFGNSSIGDVENPIADSADAPSLLVSYIKTSFDISDSTILAGLSYAKGSSRIDHSQDEENPHAVSGTSKLYGADLVIKHYLDSYSSISWQSEWLSRDIQGTQYSINPADTNIALGSSKLSKIQSGIYSQLVYTHDKNYKAGVRYENIYQNDVKLNEINSNLKNNFKKYSVMIEYHTSEFARFRVQYNKNSALYNEDNEKQNIDTIMLQANISIGAHGSHSF